MKPELSRVPARLSRLRGSDAARGVLAIVTGTAVGQALALLAAPILSRIFTPSEFGIFSIVAALAIVLGAGATLRFELAVPLPTHDDDGRALVAGGLLIGTALALVSMLLLFAVAEPVAMALGDPALEPYLWSVPAMAVTMAFFRLLNQWALRQQRYTATARRNTLQAAATVLLQIAAGLRGLGASGLIAGLALGQLVGTASLLVGARLRLRKISGERVSFNLWRYRRFAYLLAPAGVINAAAFFLPLVLIGAFYGPLAAGHFGLAQRVLGFPIALIGQAVSQVYVSELAKNRRSGELVHTSMFMRLSARLAFLATALGAAIFLLSPSLFPIVFGEQWEQAGRVSQALCLTFALQFVASPLSQTLVVFEHNATQLLWDVCRMLVTAAAMVWAYNAGASLVANVWIASAVSSIAYVVSWELSRRAIRQG